MSETNGNQYVGRRKHTKCWDCAKATGGCSWSDHLIPVQGWAAVPTELKNSKMSVVEDGSYIVIDCPLFIRDAEDGGMVRIKQTENVY